ncbi:hypothetical protein DAI22_06g215303 [Oryza sativa Japonica Group]|nr:hypothetical protein DAI22_06g215303 [Oryza sativa Japonica Group]
MIGCRLLKEVPRFRMFVCGSHTCFWWMAVIIDMCCSRGRQAAQRVFPEGIVTE